MKTHLVEPNTIGKVGILLDKEVGVFLLESAVVHYVLGVADHVGDLICLRRKHYNIANAVQCNS